MNATWWVSPSQLDDDQKAVIGLPADENHLVTGPPGSGKTNLLLLRANWLVRIGFPNLLIIVFTRTLREFISQGGSRYAFSTDKVLTSTRWQFELLKMFGGEAPPDNLPFEQMRHDLLNRVRALVTQKNLRHAFDAILLDEAQDYWPEEIQLFTLLSKRVFAVADSRQQIYHHPDSLRTLETMAFRETRLRHHYRIGTTICKFADALASHFADHVPLTTDSNYNEVAYPSSVQAYLYDSLDSQIAALPARLAHQLRAYPNDLLGVTCPRRRDVDAVAEHLLSTDLAPVVTKQSFEDGYLGFTPDTRICVSTVHSSKGLEFRSSHVLGCESLPRFALQRNMAFMMATRAKTTLNLYTTGGFPPYIEQGIAAISEPPSEPSYESLFGAGTQ